MTVLLAEAKELVTDHSQLRTFLARGRLDGAILHAGYGEGDRPIEQISKTVPDVLVNAEGGGAVPTVRLDDGAAGAVATQHLVDLGHQEISFIGGSKDSQSSIRRETGHREALEAGSGAGKIDIIHANWSAEGGTAATNTLLRRRTLPTALVVANVVTAASVLSTLRYAKIAVPEEISVVANH